MHDRSIGHSSAHADPQLGARRRARRFTAGLAIIVLVGAAAYVATRPLGNASTVPPALGAGVEAIGGAAEGVGIGQAAPDFLGVDNNPDKPILADLDGKPLRLGDFAGRPLWIVFWATWCTPCQQEASDILAAYHAHQADDLAVLAIDVQEPAAAVREFVLSHDLDYAIGLDSTAAVMALYGGRGLPAHFFLDGRGVIRDRYAGQLTAELMEQHLLSIIGP